MQAKGGLLYHQPERLFALRVTNTYKSRPLQAARGVGDNKQAREHPARHTYAAVGVTRLDTAASYSGKRTKIRLAEAALGLRQGHLSGTHRHQICLHLQGRILLGTAERGELVANTSNI